MDKLTSSAAAQRLGRDVRLAVVVGSGLGSLLDRIDVVDRVGFTEITGIPPARVPGHAGEFVRGRLGGKNLIIQSGRLHYYEGHSMAEVVSLTHLLADAGIEVLVATNAAGGIATGLEPGCLMAIDDHINAMGASPLRGMPATRAGELFCDLSRAYDAAILDAMAAAAREIGIELVRGVYMAFCGPSFETPAEIEMARRLGADAVGMSTVPEVVAARARGLRVGGVSLITNRAAGLAEAPLSHRQTLEVARAGARNLADLLENLVARL